MNSNLIRNAIYAWRRVDNSNIREANIVALLTFALYYSLDLLNQKIPKNSQKESPLSFFKKFLVILWFSCIYICLDYSS